MMFELLAGLRRRRGVLALIVTLAMLGCSAGTATAQTTPARSGLYSFTFGTGQRFSSGFFDVVDGIVKAIGGTTYDYTNSSGGQTITGLVAPGQFINIATTANDNKLFTDSASVDRGGIAYIVGGHPQAFSYSNFGEQNGSNRRSSVGSLDTVLVAAAPAPAPAPPPGAGLISWLMAASTGGGFLIRFRLAQLWSGLRGRLRLEPVQRLPA